MSDLRCMARDCGQYFTNAEALKEDVPGAVLLSCPFCLSQRVEELADLKLNRYDARVVQLRRSA